MQVLHVHPKCVGRWRRVGTEAARRWHCTSCGAAFRVSPETTLDARWQNSLDDLIELLAFEGGPVERPAPYRPGGPRWR
jgi:hypothetical protein